MPRPPGLATSSMNCALRQDAEMEKIGRNAMEDHSGIGLLRARLDELKGAKDWWLARQLLLAAPSEDFDSDAIEYINQQLAICTYKDPELRRTTALRKALSALLGQRRLPPQITSPETAGIAGAIHKRLWELDGREAHLRDALRWYERGTELVLAEGATFDVYPVVNAAYTATLLAHIRNDESSELLRNRATHLRRHVIDRLPQSELRSWWDLTSILEAQLGHRDLRAVDALVPSVQQLAATVPAWERQSTATQLVNLAQIVDPPLPPAELQSVLTAIIADGHSDAWRGFGQRFGVALSGGGFRASLFHFGVLARLAELDVLRKVEVLSCVSGGSIAGASYYAALAHLVETNTDAEITRDDVCATLAKCMDVFTNGVGERNIRMRAFFGPATLARAGALSRTKRAGWLFVQHLIRPLRPTGDFDSLAGMKVTPKGCLEFRPKRDNWNRATQVPTLLLNATSLGTGRPWRFSATSLGEPDEVDSQLDPIAQLSPIWLDRNVPPAARLPTVGDAVAASACVPALFPPLRLKGLYRDRTVSLVDGGVFDNQGVTGLLEHDCTEVFVSDASGLMPEITRPSRLVPRVLLRVNGVLMSTVRTTAAAGTTNAAQTGQVRHFWHIHMLEGLPVQRVDPIGATPQRSRDETTPMTAIPDDVQRAIAALRTDLDRFTIAEAWTLMACGYRLTTHALAARPHPLATEPKEVAWEFRAIDEWVDEPALRSRLLPELQRGSKLFLKWFPLGRRPLRRTEIEGR